MSKSRRKTPIVGNTTAESEKYDKRVANRKGRRVTKRHLAEMEDDEGIPVRNEISNTWNFQKDGKHYLRATGEDRERFMRK